MKSDPVPLSTKIATVIFRILAGGIVLLLLVAAAPWLLELAGRLLFGWAPHLMKTVPGFIAKWPDAILPLGSLALAVWLVHRFAGWCLRSRGSIRKWRPWHTFAGTAIVLFGCLAAIALSGVVHQMVWLGRGTVLQTNRRSEMVEAISNGRVVGIALADYHRVHGRYPRSLENLELPWHSITVVARGGTVREPFIFLLPARVEEARDDEALLVSPMITRDGRVAVAYGGISVRAESPLRSREILENARGGRAE